MAEISAWISLFLSILSMRARSTLRILPADREDRLGAGVAALDGRAAGRVALDDEQLALVAVAARAVLQLVGHAGAVERRLAAGGVAGLAWPRPGPAGRRCAFLTILLASVRVLLEPVAELLVGGPLHQRLDLGVAELGLGLALELRLARGAPR